MAATPTLSAQARAGLISKGTKTYDLIQRVEGVGWLTAVRAVSKSRAGQFRSEIARCQGLVMVDAAQANGCYDLWTAAAAVATRPTPDASGPYVFSTTGVGVYLGNNCMVTNCRLWAATGLLTP